MNYEKFDKLMKIANVSNRELARTLAIDSSVISRVRSGIRKPPREAVFVDTASTFLAGHISEEYQYAALENCLTHTRPLPDNSTELAALLKKWLTADEPSSRRSIAESMLTHMSGHAFLADSPEKEAPFPAALAANIQPEPVHFYYGLSGRREAVMNFLLYLNRDEEPKELFLYSDENMEWLTGDPEFLKSWAMLMIRLLRNGSTIHIIHTLERGLADLEQAIQNWMPLYMTGSVNPYILPFHDTKHQSIFVAKGIAAISATSVGDTAETTPAFLAFDSDLVESLGQQYKSFLSLAQPLMQIFNHKGKDLFLSSLKSFLRKAGDISYASAIPSLATMPKEVIKNFAWKETNPEFYALYRETHNAFHSRLKKGTDITEFLNLPPVRELHQTPPAIPFSDLFCDEPKRYTLSGFRQHLQEILHLLEEEPHYHVVLTKKFPQTAVALSDGNQIFVANATPPTTVFSIGEPDMCRIFPAYFAELMRNAQDKEHTIEAIRKYMERI